MTVVEMLVLALLLDAAIGDPNWLWHRVPHPVVVLGRAVDMVARLNTGRLRRAKGVVAILLLCGVALLIGWGVSAIHWSAEILLAASLLAHNSLAAHVRSVATALTIGVPEGRKAVSHIVGRDPENLDRSAISRAAIESAAENFSDGVIAPAFWFLLGGAPGILLYKMVNTADSMIGYKTDKYLQFGWAAARLDDVMNWIPARLSAGLIAATSVSLHAFAIMRADAGKHRSPNAGWPEAAMASVLGVALAGPRIYSGHKTDDPFVNSNGRRDIGPNDINASVMVLWRCWGGLLAALLTTTMMMRLF